MIRVLAPLFLTLSALPALACSCAPNASLPPIIVRAKVLDVVPVDGQVMARIQVLSVERGRAEKSATVWTSPNSDACGMAFKRGTVVRLGMAPSSGGRQTRGRGNYSANMCQQFNLAR